jgi:hypothetical protein
MLRTGDPNPAIPLRPKPLLVRRTRRGTAYLYILVASERLCKEHPNGPLRSPLLAHGTFEHCRYRTVYISGYFIHDLDPSN